MIINCREFARVSVRERYRMIRVVIIVLVRIIFGEIASRRMRVMFAGGITISFCIFQTKIALVNREILTIGVIALKIYRMGIVVEFRIR